MAFFIGLLGFTLSIWGISKFIGLRMFRHIKTSARLATILMFVMIG